MKCSNMTQKWGTISYLEPNYKGLPNLYRLKKSKVKKWDKKCIKKFLKLHNLIFFVTLETSKPPYTLLVKIFAHFSKRGELQCDIFIFGSQNDSFQIGVSYIAMSSSQKIKNALALNLSE